MAGFSQPQHLFCCRVCFFDLCLRVLEVHVSSWAPGYLPYITMHQLMVGCGTSIYTHQNIMFFPFLRSFVQNLFIFTIYAYFLTNRQIIVARNLIALK